jgi:hypothetical protein
LVDWDAGDHGIPSASQSDRSLPADVSGVCGKAIEGGRSRITNDLAVRMVLEDYYHYVIVLRELRAERNGTGSECNCCEGEIRANSHRRKKG